MGSKMGCGGPKKACVGAPELPEKWWPNDMHNMGCVLVQMVPISHKNQGEGDHRSRHNMLGVLALLQVIFFPFILLIFIDYIG